MKQEDKQRNYEIAETLIAEQNFAAAIIVGAAATLVAAAIYGVVTAVWLFSYGFVAMGIGIMVGLSMRFLGRGLTRKYAVLAGAYTIVGYGLGNLFRVVMIKSISRSTSPIDILQSDSLSEIAEWSYSYYSAKDFIYLPVAIFCAVYLVHRTLSRPERLAMGMYELK